MNKKLSHINNIDNQAYKVEDICAGTKCLQIPTSILKVKYIDKIGSFCKQHTKELLDLELAERIDVTDNSIVKGSSNILMNNLNVSQGV